MSAPASRPRSAASSPVRRLGDRVVQAVEGQQWLDRPSYKAEHGVALVFILLGSAGRPVRNALHGTWLGHPVHPVLTDVPIGAWTTAAVLDAVDALSPRTEGFRDAARMAVGAGVLGAAASAVTGITDWQHTHDNARRVGMVHGLVNSAALVLQVLSWRDRHRGRTGRARLVGGAGYAAVLGGAYLGGSLVYRHGIGVSHADEQLEPRDFVPVVAVDELEEHVPRRVEADGVALVLVRSAGEIAAVGQSCSHLGAPMSEGWVYRGQLVCPWHGSRFCLDDGEPASGPATAPLASYDVRVRDGQVEVRRAPRVRTATPRSTVATGGTP